MTSKNILRYAFDIGTNSIGWSILTGQRNGEVSRQGQATELTGVAAAGVRIFSDGRNPKDGSSLAMMRRGPRSARKRRDRFLRRQRKLIHLFIANGLMPAAEGERKRLEKLDPLTLRAKALDEAIAPFELGRVLFHLNQRRGFRSNRKTDAKKEDKGVLKLAQERLDEALKTSGARTLGEFLHRRLANGDGARFRIVGTGPKTSHEFYPTRKLVRDEFDKLWDKQSEFHPQMLKPEAKSKIADAIFHQRPLKAVKPGKCTLKPDEERLPAALPSVQARVIYQTVNELRYGEGLSQTKRLLCEQRDAVVSKLLMGDSISWDKLRSILKLDASMRFSLEDHRKELEGSETAKKLKSKKFYGPAWNGLSRNRQDEIVWKLLDEEDEESVLAWLETQCGLSAETAEAVANASLPDGHGRLGKTANEEILKQLIANHEFTYAKAAEAAGYHHSDLGSGQRFERLPYYAKILERHVSFGTGDPNDPDEKRYGKFANPTVHIGLNQLRKIVNRLLAKYGKPDEVVIELARALKQTKKQKEEDDKRNKKNRETNDGFRKILDDLHLPPNFGNMLRLRLWHEQRDGMQSFCPYSGLQISVEQLFSVDIDIDHILPFSRTLDDSAANKVVCFMSSNRGKKNKAPHEAFGQSPAWPAIFANASKLPPNKRWRFAADAMEKFDREGRDFLDRQLAETQHLARAAKAYLEAVSSDVWVVTGGLTALLRGKWGLNSILEGGNRKNRDDHRHHAIDAFTIGCMSRGLLNELSRRAGFAEAKDDQRIVADVPDPFPDFRDKLRDVLRAVTVSHKPEHGKDGAFHEDTAYGFVQDEESKKIGNLVYRKALDALTPNDIDKVRDPALRKELQAVRDKVKGGADKIDAKTLAAALLAYADEKAKAEAARTGKPRNPIRHARILKPEASAISIADRKTGEPYKALVPGINWCMDIVSVPDGRGGYEWKGFAISVFERNRKGWRPQWERDKIGGKLVMRLHKGDLMEIDDKDGIRRVKRIVQIWEKLLAMAGHNEGGDLDQRHKDQNDSFRWDFASISPMKRRNARKIKVNEIGGFG